jgi:hypothetical protein
VAPFLSLPTRLLLTPQEKQYRALLNDFKNFLWFVWKHLNLPDPTPVQYEVADYLQGKERRSIIQGFRGVGKSWITSAFVVWRLLRNPQEKILVVSASKQRADDFSTFTLRLIKELPITKHLIPKPDQRESKVAFDVAPAGNAHAPSVTSKGITSQLTGGRATLIIADDIEVAQNSVTQDMREKLLKAVSEFEAILVPEGDTQITYLGTPQTEESVYNKLREKGYACRIWSARYPENPDVYNGALAPRFVEALAKDPSLVGQPTDPQRFSDTDLLARELGYGRSGFSLQFMLDTSLSDAERYPLKLSDLIVTSVGDKAPVSLTWAGSPKTQIHDIPLIGFASDRWHSPVFIDPQWADYEGTVLTIDPSGRGNDELAYAVTSTLHGKIFLRDASGLKGGYGKENLEALANLAKQYKVNCIEVESNFGDGMFTELLKPVLQNIYPCTVEEVRHNTQKERRIIDTLEPVMNQHRLVVDESLVRRDVSFALKDKKNLHYSLFYQLTRLTNERGALKHDDRLDAVAMAVAYWTRAMARDEERSLDRHKEKLLDKELKDFMKGARSKSRRRHRFTGHRL